MLRPTNPATTPDRTVPASRPLPVAPQFPAVTVVADGRDAAWRHAPEARLLPDRWVAVLRAGATALSVTGRDIVRPLPSVPIPPCPAPNAARAISWPSMPACAG